MLRVRSAHKTVGVDAASLLARVAPFELVALERKRIYERVRLERLAGRIPDVEGITGEEKLETTRQWKTQLERENAPGRLTREAIVPHLEEWLNRDWGTMDFAMTQMLTGHGCFGQYLWTMQKRRNPMCLDWEEGYNDTPDHALFECMAWYRTRIEFRELFGMEHNLRDIIGSISTDPGKWKIFADYVGYIIRRKREAEMARERREDSEDSVDTVDEEDGAQLDLVRRRVRRRIAESESEESNLANENG